jgi:hypothetical protein
VSMATRPHLILLELLELHACDVAVGLLVNVTCLDMLPHLGLLDQGHEGIAIDVSWNRSIVLIYHRNFSHLRGTGHILSFL